MALVAAQVADFPHLAARGYRQVALITMRLQSIHCQSMGQLA